ncbi:hypothetical protein ACIGXM_27705 [Kitasatospora sp. NPDC052896]|uniref:hypothetical protein n=1 Tax=Kitasatospora sp. NPDC052896 TaxID=3364061 RepID=UPI0037C53C4A
MLLVQGGSTTAVVRGRTGEPVVLLAGGRSGVLGEPGLAELVDLAAAVLTAREMPLFHRCLDAFRRGELTDTRQVEIAGAALTVYRSAPLE